MTRARTIYELRRQTSILLSAEGCDVALERSGAFVRTSSGGQRRAGSMEALEPQRLWFKGTVGDTQRTQTALGEQDLDRQTLVGRWNADIEEGDLFELDGRRFVVRLVHEDRRYETRARVEEIS